MNGARVRPRCLLASVGLLAVLVRTLPAQGITRAAIQGTVTGPDGTGKGAADVLATNTSNGERWQTATTASGRYVLEQLSVGGPYRVEVRAIGFEPARRDDVLLSLGQRLRLDFTLQPDTAVLEPIVVSAAKDPLINPGRTGPSQVVPESTLARLPISMPDGTRDVTQVALLSPLVTSGPGGLSIAGQSSALTSLQVDGTSGSDLLGGVVPAGQALGLRTLAVEAVKEVQVLPAPFDVRFGNFSAGLVNAVTKSGSNQFEGSVVGYYTSRHLVGKDESGSREGNTMRDVSLTLGGPIARDRAALFLQGGVQRYTIPTNIRTIGPDTTGGADSAGVGFRLASATRLQEILRETYGVDAGTVDPYPLLVRAENVFGKLTLQLGVNSRLDLSHEYSRSTPDLLYFGCRIPGVVYCLSSAAFRLPVRSHITRLAWAAALRPRLDNELLLARLWYRQTCETSSFPPVSVHADAGDLQAGANPICSPDLTAEQTLELTDNLTLSAGSHRFTFGTHGDQIHLPRGQNVGFALDGGWHFASLDSLAAGLPDRYEATVANPERPPGPFSNLQVRQIGAYVQDQWSATSTLLLTVGLRADVPFVSRQPVANPALAAAFGLDNTRTPSGRVLWSPRLGASYDLRGDGTTFLRGGIGLFAGRPAYDWFGEVFTHTGLETLQVTCDSTNVPVFVADIRRQPVACAGSAGAPPVAGPVQVFDPVFRFPRTLKLALGADHRLPWGLVGTVDLLYSRWVNQLDLRELNLAPPGAVAPGEAGRPLYGVIASDGSAKPNRLAPAFDRVTQVRNARGDQSVSVTAQLQKHFPHGEELSTSYTYTSARDRLSATEGIDGSLDAVVLDGSLAERRLAPSAWSVPHRVTFLATANLPLRVRLTLFYEGRSGTPYTYTILGDANADGFQNDPIYVPANPVPGGDVELAVRDEAGTTIAAPASAYQDLARLIDQEPCLRRQRGQLMRRNSCRNPWTNTTNARLSKVFPTIRGQSLELTLDVFNLLHLVDSDWGTVRFVDGTALLEQIGYDAANGRGVYRLLPPRRNALDLDASRWRLQLGARYSL